MNTCLEAGIYNYVDSKHVLTIWTKTWQVVNHIKMYSVPMLNVKVLEMWRIEVLLSLSGIHTYIKFFQLPIIVPHTETIQPSKCAEFKIFPLPVVQVLSDRKYIPSSLDTCT